MPINNISRKSVSITAQTKVKSKDIGPVKSGGPVLPSKPLPPKAKLGAFEKIGASAKEFYKGFSGGKLGEFLEQVKDFVDKNKTDSVKKKDEEEKTISPENIDKAKKVLQKIKDNMKHIDLFVKDGKLIIDKPWPMSNVEVELIKGKEEEAKKMASELKKKFKDGKNPTNKDASKIFAIIDKKHILDAYKSIAG